MVFPILVSFALKENQHLWLVAMTAIAIFSALTIFLQFKFTRERVTEEQMSQGAEEEKTVKTASLKEQLSAVTSEKMWWIVILYLSDHKSETWPDRHGCCECTATCPQNHRA